MKPQCTILAPFEVEGVGLHSGTIVRARLSPAPVDSGVVFEANGVEIPATVAHVVDTQLATTLGRDGTRIRTVEHLLSTLYGLGVDNLRIGVEGAEIPALDGCGTRWSTSVRDSGIQTQGAPVRPLRILRAVEVRQGDRMARLEPSTGFSMDLMIDFDHASVGQQRLDVRMGPGVFDAELAWARTFGFERLVPAMQRMGLVRGGSLENALVFGDDGPLNEGGLRASDEPVRHKALDAMGDLALFGHRIEGRLVAERPGHGLIVALVQAVLASPDSWQIDPPAA